MNAEDVNKKYKAVREQIFELEDIAAAVMIDAIFNADQGQETKEAISELWEELRKIRIAGTSARTNCAQISYNIDQIFKKHKEYFGDE